MKYLRLLVQVPLYLLERLLDAVEIVQNAILRLLFKTEFVRRGGCAQTGQCCRAIGIEVPRRWLRYPRLIRAIQAWHFLRYNFSSDGTQDNLLVYTCNYLTDDNRCGIQRFKPKLCRDFPATPWRGFTKLHKGCGFYFEKRSGKDFGRALRQRQGQNEP